MTAKAVITPDEVIGQRLWALHVDGHAYGSLADLEAVNSLLTAGYGPGGFTVSGVAQCGHRDQIGAPLCPLAASRTLIWAAGHRFHVDLTCQGHVPALEDLVSSEWPRSLVPWPLDRDGHGPVFRKNDAGDMDVFSRVTAGLSLPPDLRAPAARRCHRPQLRVSRG